MQPVELWTGKQLFSVLLRPHASVRVYLNCTVKERTYSKKIIKSIGGEEIEVETMCPNDGFVYFRNSELICGQLGKATLGEFSCYVHVSLICCLECVYLMNFLISCKRENHKKSM